MQHKSTRKILFLCVKFYFKKPLKEIKPKLTYLFLHLKTVFHINIVYIPKFTFRICVHVLSSPLYHVLAKQRQTKGKVLRFLYNLLYRLLKNILLKSSLYIFISKPVQSCMSFLTELKNFTFPTRTWFYLPLSSFT